MGVGYVYMNNNWEPAYKQKLHQFNLIMLTDNVSFLGILELI